MKTYRLRGVDAHVPTHEVLAQLGPEFVVVQRVLDMRVLQVRASPSAVADVRRRVASIDALWTGDFAEWAVEPTRPESDVVLVHVVLEPGAPSVTCALRAMDILREIDFPLAAVERVFLKDDQKKSRRGPQAGRGRVKLIFVHMASIAAAQQCVASRRWDATWSPLAHGHVHVHQLNRLSFNRRAGTAALKVEEGKAAGRYRCRVQKETGACAACRRHEVAVAEHTDGSAPSAASRDPPSHVDTPSYGRPAQEGRAGSGCTPPMPALLQPCAAPLAGTASHELCCGWVEPDMCGVAGGIDTAAAVLLPAASVDSPYLDCWRERAGYARQAPAPQDAAAMPRLRRARSVSAASSADSEETTSVAATAATAAAGTLGSTSSSCEGTLDDNALPQTCPDLRAHTVLEDTRSADGDDAPVVQTL